MNICPHCGPSIGGLCLAMVALGATYGTFIGILAKEPVTGLLIGLSQSCVSVVWVFEHLDDGESTHE